MTCTAHPTPLPCALQGATGGGSPSLGAVRAACTLCTHLQVCSEQRNIPHPALPFRAGNTAEDSDLGCTDTAAPPGFGCEACLLRLSSVLQRRGGHAAQLGTPCYAGSTACPPKSPLPRDAKNPLLLPAAGCAGTQPEELPAWCARSPGLLQPTGTGAQGAARCLPGARALLQGFHLPQAFLNSPKRFCGWETDAGRYEIAAFPTSAAVTVPRAVSWAMDGEAAPGGPRDSQAGHPLYAAGPSAQLAQCCVCGPLTQGRARQDRPTGLGIQHSAAGPESGQAATSARDTQLALSWHLTPPCHGEKQQHLSSRLRHSPVYFA